MTFKSKQNYLYILNSIFFSIVLISFFVNPDFELKNINELFVSYATSQGFDISSRVSFYFKLIAFFILIGTNFWIIFRFIDKFINKIYTYFLSVLSVFGIFSIILYYLQITDLENVKFIISLQIDVFIYIVLNNIYGNSKKILTTHFQIIFPFVFIFSVITYFILLFFISNILVKFPIFLSLSILFLFWLSVFTGLIHKKQTLYKTIYSFIPFAFLPVLYFFATEISFYYKKNIFNILLYYGFGLILLISVLLFILRFKKAIFTYYTTRKIIYNYYFPVFLIAILIFEYYTPFLYQNTEMFEKANSALAIQQFFDFGKIPFLQTFGSHALSEIFFGFIYTAINGFNGITYEIFNFFNIVIYYLLAFLILRKITDSNIFSILLIALLPFVTILIPQYFYFSLISIFILLLLLKKQTVFNYFLFFTILAFSLLWRIDVGVAVIPALIVSFVIYFTVKAHKKIKFIKLLAGFGFFILTITPFIIFATVKSDNLKTIFTDILSYLSSAQTYGMPSLTYKEHDYIFYFHFIIFPSTVILSLIYGVYRLRTTKTKSNILQLIIIFLSVYYIFNFQRGIVRHSFIEGWDTAISSFVFLILTLVFIDFVNTKSRLKTQTLFLTISLILILGFHYPQNSIEKKSNINILKHNILNYQKISNNFIRTKQDTAFYKKTILGFYNFTNNILDSGQTFIDMSNNPMLYFYTHKNNPNYFNQPLLSSHSSYLQTRFINQIKKQDVPIIVYSNYPKNWWDKTDGIPNNLRYYKISEYINKNYKPFAIISNKCVWKRNDFNKTKIQTQEILKNDSSLKFNKTSNIIFLDTLYNRIISDCNKKGEIMLFDSVLTIKKQKKYLFTLKGNIYPYNNLTLQYETSQGIKTNEIETKNTYFGYTILNTENTTFIKNIKLLLNKNQRFNFEYFSITENNYIPDFYSTIFNYPAKIDLIPYVWGNMSKQIIDNNYKITDTLGLDFIIDKNKTKNFNISTNKVLNSNYLLISARSNKKTYISVIYSTNYTNKGGYKFIIKKSDDFKNYILCFGADYNWNNKIKKLKLITSDNDIEVSKVLLIKN